MEVANDYKQRQNTYRKRLFYEKFLSTFLLMLPNLTKTQIFTFKSITNPKPNTKPDLNPVA